MTITKSVVVLMLICFFVTVANAQEVKQAPKLPVDEASKLISYSKVNEVAGISMKELYNRAIIWCTGYYKNSAEVIRERDSVNGEIICKARYKIMNPADKKGFATEAGVVMYTLKLSFKDGKYKYIISDINWKQASYYPIEKWMDQKSSSYKPEFDFYLQQVDEKSREVIKDFEKALIAVGKPAIKKGDW